MRKLGGRGTVRVLLCLLNRGSGLRSAWLNFAWGGDGSVSDSVYSHVGCARKEILREHQCESSLKQIRRAVLATQSVQRFRPRAR
jgi:hypothetical protein